MLCLALALCIGEQSVAAGTSLKVSGAVDHFVRSRGFSGNILVTKAGHEIYFKSFGKASVELDVPNIRGTKFKIFSTSKQMTALAAMLLVQDGKLDLDSPISSYLGTLPNGWRAITMRMLLRHTSGVPQSFENVWIGAYAAAGHPSTLLPVFAKVRGTLPQLDFAAGSNFRYSNMGYIIAGCVIEALSGIPFTTFVKTQVFSIADMRHSTYDSQQTVDHSEYSGNAIVPGLAAGYTGTPTLLETAYSMEYVEVPAGGVISTVDDLNGYCEGFFSNDLLSGDATAAMYRHPYKVSPTFSYGLGWEVRKVADRTVVFHSGGSNGFSADMAAVPEEHICVSVLSNRGFDDVEGLTKGILRAVLSA